MLEAYRSGSLTKRERAEVRHHLDWCRECLPLLEGEAVFDCQVSFSEDLLKRHLAALEQRYLAVPPGLPIGDREEVPSDGPSKVDRLLEETIALLKPTLRSRLMKLEEQGHDAEVVHSASGYAQRMLTAVPEPSAWDRLLGPFYRTRQVADILGLSPAAVTRRKHRRSLLGLKTEDGMLVYPAFQFDSNNRLLNGLPATLRCFRDVPVDDWTLAGWLTSPHDALGGYSVLEALQSGVPQDGIVAFARDTARRFSQ